ncbi:MAG: cobalamin-independent methionine synthase II family protein [Chloroflexi bacterium]|nr:cobalamin-independent methionine synthase II family protein [Chloroflexota bacterium]
MSKLTSIEPFSTFVVGSLPRPQWVRDVIEERKAGTITYAQADADLDTAIPSAVRLQERAGIDYVSDGEWRRESYIKVFSEHVGGFSMDASPQILGSFLSDPAVSAPMSQHSDISTDAARFLKQNTENRTIVSLPSPYILGWRMWKEQISTGAYPTREEFIAACIPIIRDEIGKLASLGISHVQLDEPWLLMMADPAHRKRVGAGDLNEQIDLCIKSMNETVAGAGIPLSMHLCHGHFDRERATDTGYEPIIEALGDINVDRFAMEFAAPQSHGVQSLREFPKDKILGLGVIDHCDPRVETAEDVAVRAGAAMEYVDGDRITLNPDCGFSPGAQNPMDLDEAYAKLRALVGGAAIVSGGDGGI